MKIITDKLQFSTKGNTDILDITEQLQSALLRTKLKEGLLVVFVIGSTGGLGAMEYEKGLVSDTKRFFEELAPEGKNYLHDRSHANGNAHSHLRATLLGPCLTLPFTEGRLLLGVWQQIVFMDFDTRQRQREIVVQAIGE